MNPTASQIARLMACPASHSLPHSSSTNEAAQEGTEIHEYLEQLSDGRVDRAVERNFKTDRAYQICNALEVERLPIGVEFATEVALAFDVSTLAGRQLLRGTSRERTYEPLRPFEIGMTTDVVAMTADAVHIWDYKSGRADKTKAQHHWQLRTNAVAAASVFDRDKVVAHLIHVPDEGVMWTDRAEFDMFDLDVFGLELREMFEQVNVEAQFVKEGTAKFHSGPHCRYCPAFNSCPDQMTIIRQVADGDAILNDYRPVSMEKAADTWHKVAAIEAGLKKIKSALHGMAVSVGPIDLGDGTVLEERETVGNEKLDGEVAHEVLTEMRGSEVAFSAVKYTTTKTAMHAALKESLKPKEKIGALMNEAVNEIRKRGGSKRKTSRKVKVFPVEPKKLNRAGATK